jgi:hypothetical protein
MKGKILERSYKTKTMKNGATQVSFSIKDNDGYHNFRTFVEKGMDVPPYIGPNKKVTVNTEGSEEESWDWEGKTYSCIKVHLSMITANGEALEAKNGVSQPEPVPLSEDSWLISFGRYQDLLKVYSPTQAGDLTIIARMAGYKV